MPEYVITVRNAVARQNEFGDDIGPAQFLEVPDGAPMEPSQAIGRADWVRKVIQLTDPRKDASGATRGDLLVFVHGYDNTPANVLARHRVLKSDLPQHGYKGGLVSFDWPSGDIALAYLPDREKAKLTAFRLVSDCIELFASLQGRPECETNVHVLAHSTGAYVVREAFDDADDRRNIASVNWTASQIVLIAGDVSADSLSSGNPASESLYRHCLRLTNYSNPFDEVLQIANVKRVGLAPRVGRVGLPADIPAKAVNVECGKYYRQMTPRAQQIIGYPSHSWFIGDPVFTKDLARTLNGDLDRSAIPTRTMLPNGRFELAAPQTAVASASPVPPAP